MHTAYIGLLSNCYIRFRGTKDYLDCEIIAIKPKYFPRPRSWAFPKDSPYLKLFDFYMRHFLEKGQYKALEAKYSVGKQVCNDTGGLPIDFTICVTAFLILLTGLMISMLLLLCEATLLCKNSMNHFNVEYTS